MTVEDLKKYFKNKSEYDLRIDVDVFWDNIKRWHEVDGYVLKTVNRMIISYNETSAEIISDWELKELEIENIYKEKIISFPKNKIYINLKNTNYNQFKKIMDSSIKKAIQIYKQAQVQNKLYKMAQDF